MNVDGLPDGMKDGIIVLGKEEGDALGFFVGKELGA